MPTVGGIVVATGAEASGRRTLQDIIDELARPVDASDSTVRAFAGDAFRAAVRSMNRKGLWPWEIMDEEVAITANSKFSTVTSAIKKPLSMHYLDQSGGNPTQRITYISYDRFMEKWNQDISGQADTYTIPNLFETGQIRWFPVPSAAFVTRFTFYRVTPAPRIESEPVEIPDYAIETYMSMAWYEFVKRTPAAQKIVPLTVAWSESRIAFRELSAHVNSPGDRSREVSIG